MSLIVTLIAWHKNFFPSNYLSPKMRTMTIFCALILGFIATCMAFQARHINWQIWEQNKAEFFYEETPLFTTMDAGFFLSVAGHLKSGKTMDDYLTLRSFPKNQAQNKSTKSDEQVAPLLSKIIAYLAKNESPKSLLIAGNKMLPYTAAITAVAIFLAFAATGYWLEASVAAAGGTLSISYYWRSSIGRIDTDQLNLGFMYLMFSMVMLAGRSKDIRFAFLFTVLAGLTAHFFMLWYGKSELIFMAAIALIWLNLVLSHDWRRVAGLTIVFLLLSGVEFVNPFGSIYIETALVQNNFIFNNVISTVTEATKIDFSQILTRMTGNVLFGFFCILGLILWMARHPVMALAYSPLAAFFLFSVIIGNRAIFYSAPFFWFGAAFLIVLGVKNIVNYATIKLPNLTQYASLSASFTFCLALLGFIWFTGPINETTKPSISPSIIKAMSEIDDIAGIEKSVVASWWDYGYSSMLFNNLPTFTDPGSHGSNVNYFIADALLSNNQQRTANTLRFLARGGLKSIKQPLKNKDVLFERIMSDRDKSAPTVYLMLTDQMSAWIPSIATIGKWDIDLGEPISARGHKPGQQLSYNFLNCVDTQTVGILNCNNSIINLNEGKIDGNPVLNLVAEARGGILVGSKGYRRSELNMFQIMRDVKGRTANIALLHKELFFSSYNQMFHLGRFDASLFKLVYDSYPSVRIYKVL